MSQRAAKCARVGRGRGLKKRKTPFQEENDAAGRVRGTSMGEQAEYDSQSMTGRRSAQVTLDNQSYTGALAGRQTEACLTDRLTACY